MAVRRKTKAAREVTRKLARLKKQYLGLRAKANRLRRGELTIWRKLEKLAGRKPVHMMAVIHRRGRKDEITHHPPAGSPSLMALARARGSSGLLCGCSPIIIKQQPNEDIDICILIACSDDPATTGFRCEYWCTTLEAPPVVGIARVARRRRRSIASAR
ncbi:MAG TPA: hypothetical protein VFO74_06330 [Pseudolabrys sp.]|jgi:hypothetical protein|nr:hypothetical protein [Pseudolabrys sp.]